MSLVSPAITTSVDNMAVMLSTIPAVDQMMTIPVVNQMMTSLAVDQMMTISAVEQTVMILEGVTKPETEGNGWR